MNEIGIITNTATEIAGVANKTSVVLTIFIIIFGVIATVLSILVYFLPGIIAYKRGHANKGIILLLNFLLGWTFLGWAGALVWAFIDTERNSNKRSSKEYTAIQLVKHLEMLDGNKYEDLARLQKLKEDGAISEVEFEIEKQKLLR